MRRKLFNQSGLRRAAAASALLLTSANTARAQEAVQAQMWAATARYVYNDDPNLKPLAAKLSTELGEPKTLGEFEQKLAAAATEAAAASKTPNIKVLQRQFQNMRALNAVELNDNLPDSLSKTAVRRQGDRKQKLDALENTLMTLAQGNSGSSVGATPSPAAEATTPAAAASAPTESYQVAAQPAGTSPLTWAALVMSGLSLLGVIRILSSRRSRHSSSSSSESGRSHASSASRELSPEQHREVEAMIARALAGQSDKQVVAQKLAPKPAPTPASQPQSVKQKLASNSPKAMRPSETESSLIALPPLASMAAEVPAPTPPVAAPPTSIAEPEPIPAVVEPGTSIELDVTPTADTAPKVRQQFVNEAPFNNTFAARTLSDALAPYSIYEVQIRDQTPDQGQFRVVGNLVSHISNHRNILEPVCEYVAYPQGGETRIITEQPGEVRRRGEDWEVVRRARIRFE
jgi:hypothetical protein